MMSLSSKRKVAVGGTFDHLHRGHRRLLQTALQACQSSVSEKERSLIVGVALEPTQLDPTKQYSAWIEPYEARVHNIRTYIDSINNDRVKVEYMALEDPWGPLSSDPAISALIVSPETEIKVAGSLDGLRKERGLPPVQLITVEHVRYEPQDTSFPLGAVMCSTDIRRQLCANTNKHRD
jgi:cytidyltransferase-like protein